jgi:hypothetical protein
MTEVRDLERLLDAWLGDDGSMLPDRVIDASLAQIETTPQRRILVPWRIPTINSYARMAVAALVAVVLVGSGIAVLVPGGPAGPGGAPSPSASPSAAPSPSPSPSPSPAATPVTTTDWQSFISGRYGYRAAYPPTSTGMPGSTGPAPTEVTPASRDWSIEKDGAMFTTIDTFMQAAEATDLVVMGPDGSKIAITGFAAAVPAGMSEDDWIAAYNTAQNRPSRCTTAIDWRPITVDGAAGRLDPCGDAQAFVFRDGRVYVFSIWQPDHVALLEAFLSTVRWEQ